MNKQKYRNFLITSILTAIVIIVVSTVMYVKDRLPNTIFINTNTSTKYNFSMPVSLNVENKTRMEKILYIQEKKVNIAGNTKCLA